MNLLERLVPNTGLKITDTMHVFAFIALLTIPIVLHAQMYKCVSPDGKHITYTDSSDKCAAKHTPNLKMGFYAPSAETSRKNKMRRSRLSHLKELEQERQHDVQVKYWISRLEHAPNMGTVRYAKRMLDALNGVASKKTSPYKYRSSSGEKYKYRSRSGIKYKYDLSNPLDRMRYEHDPLAQLKDRNKGRYNLKVGMDRRMGQYGGGME